MKDRITLLLIISCLLAFLVVFQNYFRTSYAVVFLICFMALYMLYMYLSIKHQRRKLRKNPQSKECTYKPFISIMIPCHNEHEVILDTVKNIINVNYNDFELILIDDRSTDDTAQIIKELEANNPKIKALIREKTAFPGKSAVLNDALKIAKGEAILVFDADARIEPEFINLLLPKLEPETVGAVQARKTIINAKQNFLTTCQYNEYVFDSYLQIGRDAVKGAVELRGNGEIIKRKALEEAKDIIKKLGNTDKVEEKFIELAKDESDDTTASEGGLIENFTNESGLVEEFWEASLKLENGKYTTEPVETEFGYHIIYKVSQKEKPALEDVKEKILDNLVDELLSESNDNLIYWAGLREKYNMNILDEVIKDTYDSTMKLYK